MKSVLIIDTPEDCLACPCFSVIGSEHCSVTMKEVGLHIPKWCPLRPLPEKDEEPEDDLTDYVQQDYDRMASYFYGLINGRNNVINEILGETE